jgi:hypothetical protein
VVVSTDDEELHLVGLADAIPGSVIDGRADWERLRSLFDEPEDAETGNQPRSMKQGMSRAPVTRPRT